MIPRLLLAIALFFLAALLGLSGGGDLSFDRLIVQEFVGWRARNPDMSRAIIRLTQLGDGPVLLADAALAAALIAFRDRARAVALILAVAGGRLLIEVLKLAFDRPRPSFDAHPVWVYSQSFPSGHAGNSMITFGAIALFALPGRWRTRGLVAAIILAVLVGATRPMIGVHWPTDVIGGWVVGGGWLALCWALWLRFRQERA